MLFNILLNDFCITLNCFVKMIQEKQSLFPVFLVSTITMSSSAVMLLPALAGLFLLALAEVKAHAAALTQVADMLGHLGHGRRLTVHAACLPTGHLHIVCPQRGQCCHLGPLWTTALLTVRG